MANKVTMKFKRGDDLFQYFQIPTASFVAGGTLHFTAKPAVDNDNTDAAAVIDKSFLDSDIVDSSHDEYESGFETYEMAFTLEDITNVTFSNGEKAKKYLGEFQIVGADGKVESFPNDDNFIEVIIYADIKRGES